VNEKLSLYAKKFEAFSVRERLMVILAIIAVVYVLFDFTVLSPLKVEKSQVSASVEKWKMKIADINQQVRAITATFNEVKSSNVDHEVAALKNKLNASNKRMESLIYSFVRPQQMADVLRNLLQQEQGLKLMRLQSQRVQPLLAYKPPLESEVNVSDQSEEVQQLLDSYRNQLIKERQGNLDTGELSSKESGRVQTPPDIFRHGIEIEFYGDFKSTVSYLEAVEALPWRFYWEEVSYTVEEYPRALVKVIIYTLSLDRGWIDV